MLQPIYLPQTYKQNSLQQTLLQQKLFSCSPHKPFEDEGYTQRPSESTTTKFKIFSSKDNYQNENYRQMNFVPLTQRPVQNRPKRSIFDHNPSFVLQTSNNQNNYERNYQQQHQIRAFTPNLTPNLSPHITPNLSPHITPNLTPRGQIYNLTQTPQRQILQQQQHTPSNLSPLRYSQPNAQMINQQPINHQQYQNYFAQKYVGQDTKPKNDQYQNNQVSFTQDIYNEIMSSQPKIKETQQDEYLNQYMNQKQQQPIIRQAYSQYQEVLPQFYNPNEQLIETEQTESQYDFKSMRTNHELPNRLENLDEQQPVPKNLNYQRLQDELLKSQQRLEQLNQMSSHYQNQRKHLTDYRKQKQETEQGLEDRNHKTKQIVNKFHYKKNTQQRDSLGDRNVYEINQTLQEEPNSTQQNQDLYYNNLNY